VNDLPWLTLEEQRKLWIANELGFNRRARDMIEEVHKMTNLNDKINILNDLKEIKRINKLDN